MSKPPVLHHFNGDDVMQIMHIKDNYYTFADAGVIIIKDKNSIFADRKEAMYQQFMQKILAGNNINNYKRSKYYEYYIERLKTDHPEYLI